MSLKGKVLFADIDGTLVRRSLEQWLIVYLRQRRLLKKSKLVWNSFGHMIRWPLPRWFQWKLVYLQGFCESEVDAWIRRCWTEYVKPAFYMDSLTLLDEFRKRGGRIVLLSGTPLPLAGPLMKHLGLDEAICAEPILIDGCYTGGLKRPHPRGRVKVNYVREWLDARGMDWHQTCAMADHWHDRHLLEKVCAPVAVHPGPDLARVAREAGWPILDSDHTPENVMKTILRRFDAKAD